MSLEQILDRLEKVFKQESQERALLLLLMIKTSTPMSLASVIIASFPYVLDSVRILQTFLCELEKPDVLPIAQETVPHIFLDC